MSLTSDSSDPRLGRGVDTGPGPQNEAYLILSDEERAKGFVRPVRRSYFHVGIPRPQHPLRDLTGHEQRVYGFTGYVKFEQYPESGGVTGRLWTQRQLDTAGKGCGTMTTMPAGIAETYARDPGFYGATYCCGCRMHLPVGERGEFTWADEHGRDTGVRVGT